MRVILDLLYTLQEDYVSPQWNKNHDHASIQEQQTLAHNSELTLPNTKNPFLMADSSAI